MRDILPLVEMYLTAESALVAAVDAAGGTVSLPDGRTVSVSDAEDATVPTNTALRGVRWTKTTRMTAAKVDGRTTATKRSHPGNETVAAKHPNNSKTGCIRIGVLLTRQN